MRIISGTWKGKRLTAPKNLPTRPTTDFAKEALFNILHHRYYLDEIKVLDLFGGIGSISFEFASRGAVQVDTVEQNAACVRFIEKTTQLLKLDSLSVFRRDVFSFIDKKAIEKYDLIFADPPFDMENEGYDKLISKIFENEWLADDGTFVLEHSKHCKDFSEHPHFSELKKYGNVRFSFFEKI